MSYNLKYRKIVIFAQPFRVYILFKKKVPLPVKIAKY